MPEKTKDSMPINILQELDTPLDSKVVKQREGAGGRSLDYLPGWWVIKNANRIFGLSGWSYDANWALLQHIELPPSSKGTITGFYLVPVTLTVWIDGHEVKRSDVGLKQYHGEGNKEMAIKGCVTDGLKRCFRTFGNQFGLGLYGESDDEKEDAPSVGLGASKEEMVTKFGLNPKQVNPKCGTCGTEMGLTPRKDGTGVFWGCPNWREGCKPVNIQDVGVDGIIVKKEVEKAPEVSKAD